MKPEDFLERIFQTIRDFRMIEPGMRVLAGVSGGADSVCLLLALDRFRAQLPFELAVVHVEHGLRGRESLDDAAFVEQLCAKRGVPCRVIPAEVKKLAKEQGLSCEEAGRICRYRIFEELRQEWKADRVAVAHQEGDQAETVLWNLIRGSGLKGLCGIRPVRGFLIRPLLFTPRSEIEEFLTVSGQDWRIDRTNLEPDFTRNRLRLYFLPQLERELNPQAVRHIAQAGRRLLEAQELIEKMAGDAAKRSLCRREGDVLLLLAEYEKEEPLIRRELLKIALAACGAESRGALSAENGQAAECGESAGEPARIEKEEWALSAGGMKDIGAVHLSMLERLAGQPCGKSCDLPGGIRALRENGRIRFRRKGRQALVLLPDSVLPLPGSLRINGLPYGWPEEPDAGTEADLCVTAELFPNTPALEEKIREEKRFTKWLTCDTMPPVGKERELQLRTRRTGDYLIVNAQGGKKKLKDYLMECRIPRERRDQVWLLADGPHVLWVIGWRISEAAKVRPETRQAVRIQIEACRPDRPAESGTEKIQPAVWENGDFKGGEI